MKHYSSPEGKCPFYLWEEPGKNQIQCEGMIPSTKMSTVFPSADARDAHRDALCYDLNGWEYCPLARALERKYR